LDEMKNKNMNVGVEKNFQKNNQNAAKIFEKCPPK